MTISQDLRLRAVEAYRDNEGSQRKIAERFKISRSTLRRWLTEAEVRPEKPETRGRKPLLDEEACKQLKVLALAKIDLTEPELAQALAERGYPRVSRAVIGRLLREMGVTRKKRHGAPVNKTDPMFKSDEKSGKQIS